MSSEEIKAKLQELTTGLCYQSEADYPLEVVQFEVALPDILTEKELVALTGNAAKRPVEVTDVASFFRHVTTLNNETPLVDNTAKQIVILQAFCEQHLQNTKVYRIGSRILTALLLGKSSNGLLLGLQTTIVQT
ncbi:nuclease A inhibitor family protein [Adhaeribacter pallidiroseus]|uniref:nuclease A inhibitor family protein n=1 Tax=Adhaeribacter pallidiroseus TaxID=2072847 RepID=UPI0013140C5D|nr:nuclease A inhibitor family protein [Adhaeribacter pallidiroseus]